MTDCQPRADILPYESGRAGPDPTKPTTVMWLTIPPSAATTRIVIEYQGTPEEAERLLIRFEKLPP